MGKVKKIFIVGSSRSGTTMLSQILGNHSEIFSFNELHFFEQITLPEDCAKELQKQDAIEKYSKLINIQANGLFKFIESKNIIYKEADLIYSQNSKLNSNDLFDEFLNFEVKKNKKKYACEQTPTNIFYIENILKAYPDALFIHMVRDPRGVLLSQKNRWRRRFKGENDIPIKQSLRNFFNYHPYINGLLWTASVKKGLKYINDPRFFLLQFENLLSEPETYLRKVCEFIGITYESKMLEIPLVGSSNNKNKNETNTKKTGIRPFVKDQWKAGGISKGEIFINQLITKDIMKKLDYPYVKTGYPLSAIPLFCILPFKIGISVLFNLGRVKSIRRVILNRLKSNNNLNGKSRASNNYI
ncbi:sulfotransferase family protein [Parafilimonas terrae]|uniref:Sulfotransferase family protein n=1 Tax=Parafilimonas terrae TaxID=1465490 RepID=A0A1I5Z4S3_9BACT|nr:sulfotransferase [Parafilimonas terrae]SFQ51461.1 Sulfotransferase family protein [Parafilimonas terrae]